MTTRKRRPPEKRQAGRVSRLIADGAALIGAAAMRNPVATGGTAAFAIVFSFVAANALWYQPSSHPHPWLDTRDAFRDYAAKAMHPAGNELTTTYRVERDAVAPAASPAAATPKPAEGVVVHDDAVAAPAPQSNDLVSQVQANLLRRGLYDGPVDGVMGSKTEAAIMFYQETRGLPETGAADASLLDLLKKDNSEFNIIPPDRPSDVTGAIAAKAPQKPAADPVAALIAKTPRQQPAAKPAVSKAASEPAPVPPAPIPAAAKGAKPAAKPAPEKPAAQKAAASPAKPVAVSVKAEAPARQAAAKPDVQPSNLVMAIQKGLSNLAYRDVTVDGVPGEQTKEAIRHFQKHYRLPVTGEPDEAVLEKLKKIGAL
jgi:peptidoglycan hydrolase-like protein with peptidoglycan-binding domain